MPKVHSQGDQQGERKKPKGDFRIRLKYREPRPKRESARVDFDGYLRSKKFSPHEVKKIGQHCSGLFSVLDDVCPVVVRLAPIEYPRKWLQLEHVNQLKEYITERNRQGLQLAAGEEGPIVQGVLSVDGYALVLAKDEFTAEFVRALLPLMATDHMELKETTPAEMREFNSTRHERADPNILVKYRNKGWKSKKRW